MTKLSHRSSPPAFVDSMVPQPTDPGFDGRKWASRLRPASLLSSLQRHGTSSTLEKNPIPRLRRASRWKSDTCAGAWDCREPMGSRRKRMLSSCRHAPSSTGSPAFNEWSRHSKEWGICQWGPWLVRSLFSPLKVWGRGGALRGAFHASRPPSSKRNGLLETIIVPSHPTHPRFRNCCRCSPMPSHSRCHHSCHINDNTPDGCQVMDCRFWTEASGAANSAKS